MTTIFTLQGATIMLTGRFSKMTHEQLAACYEAQGATVVSLVGLGLDYMVAGQGYSLQRAQAMNMGIPILDEDDAYRLQHRRDMFAREEATHGHDPPEGERTQVVATTEAFEVGS